MVVGGELILVISQLAPTRIKMNLGFCLGGERAERAGDGGYEPS